MSSRKRKPEEAGIKIHVKKEDMDGPDDEEIDDEEKEDTPVQQAPQPQGPLVKRVIKRRHQQQQQESGDSMNLFAGIGAKFGQPNKPSFSASAFGGSSTAAPSGNPFSSSIGSFGSSFGSSAGSAATSTSTPAANFSTPSLLGGSATPALAAAPVTSTGSTSLQTKEGSLGNTGDDQYRAMVALNTSFLSWLSNKVKMSPESSLVDGVRKYIEHCNSISSNSLTNGVHLGISPAPSTAAGNTGSSSSSSSAPFAMPATSTSSSSSMFGSSSASSAPSAPLFQAATTKEDSTTSTTSGSAKPSLFGSSNGSAFGQANSGTTTLFGQPAISSGSATSLFGQPAGSSTSLFGQSSTASGSSTSLFGGQSATSSLFGNTAAPSSSLFASSAKPKTEDEEGENEGGEDDDEPEPSEPTKEAQRHVSTDETTLFEIEPCKVMVLKDKAWANRGGKGRLVISRHNETNKCRALLRATATGAIYFNASVNHSMLPTLSKQKNTVRLMTSSVVTNEKGDMQVDNDGKPTLYAFKVMTEDDAEKLRAALADVMK